MHSRASSLNFTTLLTFATIVLCTLNALLIARVWKHSVLFRELRTPRPHNFEYTSQPLEVPASFSPSSMIMQIPDSAYPVGNDRIWGTIDPLQLGFIRLGPDGTPFSIAMFHQLHCLNAIRFAYRGARDGLLTPGALAESFDHVNHCFDIVRHGVLCRADTTLVRTEAGNGTIVLTIPPPVMLLEFLPSSSSYQPLRQDDQQLPEHLADTKVDRSDRFGRILLIVAIANVFMAFALLTTQQAPNVLQTLSLADLPKPDPYIGLNCK
ncbi:hypothetical protein MVEN_02339900 [Mycena venus]|uniref:Uncharacterized protein n=1 Tax=Mycena venus TaxID=2733690 RepID=A0A8H6X477_9AGAR|nr:hypothetical protein MVEN_02339900 [Mycena venus]